MATVLGDDRHVRTVLRRWFAAHLAEDESGPVDEVDVRLLEPPEGGQSSATVPVSVTWNERGRSRTSEHVVRLRTADNPIYQDSDVIREFRVLKALRGTQVPTPATSWAEEDPSLLGSPFFVMERVPGVAPNDRPSIHSSGWLTTLSTPQRETLWASAMGCLAAVHLVPWRRTHTFLAGTSGPDHDLETHLHRLTERYRWAAAGREFPITDLALTELHARRRSVAENPPSLLWGDARLANMLFAEDVTVAAVIDWELASIGPPEIDIGWWLMWDEYLTDASGVPRLPGFPDRERTVTAYESATGRVVQNLDYYQLLAALQLATTMIRITDIGISRGRFPAATRMAHANIPTQMIARQLGLFVPELDPDERRRRGLDRLPPGPASANVPL